jgi:regulator of sigma E protease
MNLIIFFVILLVLVLVHEFGHFITAKKFGIRVDEFGFGFPPKLFGRKYGETEYTINALPFGGFVRIFGENPDEDSVNGPDARRSFVNSTKWKQAVVLVAGVFANLLLAWVLFSVGFMFGLPTSVGTEAKNTNLKDIHLMITSVMDKSPAQNAGLKAGDKIVFIKNGDNSTTYISPETIKSVVSLNQEIQIGYLRGNDKTQNFVNVTPEVKEGVPMIGISMDQVGIQKLPFLGALIEGMKLTLSVSKGTVLGLFGLIRDGLTGVGSFASVAGPVGMVGIVGDAYQLGFVYLISFTALISINLAVINLFPFPALDGGRLLFLLIEKIKGSRINSQIANTANFIGFAILILLMLFITYHDVVKLF